MSVPVRILVIEDLLTDFELAQREIRKVVKGCEFQRVETRKDFLKALETFQPDLILSDYSLPRFDGMKALKLTLERAPLTPLIIWTGSMSEDVAAECMKAGANNYVLKENIKRLGVAITHALEERRLLMERKQAEEKYRAIFENSLEGIFQSTPQGRFISVNPAMARIYGYASPQEMIESVTNIANQIYVEPDHRNEFIQVLQAKGFVENFEMKNLRKDGSIFWTSTSARVVYGPDGDALCYEGFLQEVTERKQAEERLRESRARYHALFEQSHDAIFILDFQGRHLDVNQRAADMLGYTSSEIRGLSVKELSAEPDQSEHALQRLNNGEHIPVYERLFRKKDGSIVPVEINAELVRDAHGNPLHIQSVVRDITERKQAEEALAGSEKRFRALIENGLDEISLLNAEGTLLWESPSVIRTLDYAPGAFVGRNILELVHPDDLEWISAQYGKVVRVPGSRQCGSFRLRHSNGTWRWVEAIVTNMLHEPSVNAIVVNYRDITERKQAEEALQSSEAKYRSLVENSLQGISIYQDGRMVYANSALCKMNGYTAEELLGMSADEIIAITHPDDRDIARERAEKRRNGEAISANFEFRIIKKDGSTAWWQAFNSAIIFDGKPAVLSTVLDITERKQAEDKLRESEQRLIQALSGAQMSVWEWDLESNNISWSPEFFEITGTKKDGLDRTFESFTNLIHPQDAERVRASAQKSLADGSLFSEEFRITRSDGEVRWLSNLGRAEHDPSRKYLRLIGTVQDITQRKQAEFERRALLEIMQGLANTKDLQEFLSLIHRSIAKVIYAENFFVSFYHKDSGLFEEIYSVDQYDPPLPPSKMEKSITSYIFRSGEPLLLTKEKFDELVTQGEVELLGTDSASWLGAPLKTQNGIIGVMVVQDYENPNRYSEHDKEFLASIGSQVAIAIERKQAEDVEREQRTLAEALLDTAETLNSSLNYGTVLDQILAAVGRVVPHNAATIMLIDEGEAHAVRLRGHEKHGFDTEVMETKFQLAETANLRQMLETRQPLVISDTQTYPGWKNLPSTIWIHSNVGAPIIIQGEVIGFILLDSETSGFFTPVHAERLRAFANQAALAIHNARLLQQAQEEIAERKQVENALRESQTKYQNLVETSHELIWSVDGEGRYTFVNRAAKEIYGYEPEELIGRPFFEIMDTDDPISELEKFKEYIANANEFREVESHVRHRDGRRIILSANSIVLRDPDGKVIGVSGSSHNITERKQVENALREGEEKYRLLFDSNPLPMWIYDLETLSFLKVNDAAVNHYGYSVDEFMSMTIKDIRPAEDVPRLLENVAHVTSGMDRAGIWHHRKKDGTLIHVEIISHTVEFEGRRAELILVNDVTERERAEIELRNSEERFRQLADNIEEVFWMTDIGEDTEETTYISPAAERVWGRSVEDNLLALNDFMETIWPEDKDRMLSALERQRNGEKTDLEYRIRRPDGAVRWIWDRAFPILDDSGKVIRLAGIAADITERKQAENALANSEERFSSAFEFAPIGIALVAPDGKWLKVNQELCSLTGYTEQELMAKTFQEITHPEDLAADLDYVDQMLAGKINAYQMEKRYIHKLGHVVWALLSVSLVKDSQGMPQYFISQIQDITERRQSDKASARHLTELEALYENGLAVGRLLEPREIGERIIETFSRYLSWHHVTIRLRKENSDELELVAFNLPGLKEEDRAEAEENFVSRINKVGQGMSGWVVQTGEPIRSGKVNTHPRYVDTHEGIQSGLYMPLKVGERVIGVISVESEEANALTAQDERLLATLANQAAIAFENARLYQSTQQELIERKRAEYELRTSEVHYRELADSITDVFFELDHNLNFSHWNIASEALTGVAAKDAMGKSLRDMFGESAETEKIEKIYEAVLTDNQPRSFETFLILNNARRFIEVNAYPSTRGVSVVAKDVTDRKRAETILEKRFELMEYSAGHSLDEVMRKTVDEVSKLTDSQIGFLQFMEADQITPGLQTWSTETVRLFKVPLSEGQHRRVDQAGVWAEALRQRRSVIHNDYQSLPNKKGVPAGHIIIKREMVIPIIRSEKIVAVMGVGNKSMPYTQQDLEIAERFADYAWDITERKQMEITLADERNQLAQRVEERTSDLSRANSNLARALRVKDEFLANMSHELRTPLNAILGLSESLAEQTAGPLNEKQLRYISTIGESGHHLLSLINDILDLAKIEAGQITLDVTKVDVNSVCQASLRMIKQLAQKKNQNVMLKIDEDLGLIWADERRLKQMMVNLLSNAVKFTPEGGRLGLDVHGNQEENEVTITVWDNGIGISERDMTQLFLPFVQLDSGLAREATGTGLGLALVAQMARLHGGSVTVDSQPGQGSRFTIRLPWEPAAAVDIVERKRVTGKLPPLKLDENKKPTILLVEDTLEVTMMISDYLESNGYKIVTAQDGIEGIDQAKNIRPDLILMDIMMPRMDGLKATQELRGKADFKQIPIIGLTALAMPEDRDRCIAAGMDDYISKPVNLKALVKTIQKYLSSAEEIKLR